MKQPSKWSTQGSKAAGAWTRAVKTAVAWAGSSLVKPDAPAGNWAKADVKAADQWTVGHYTYNSYLTYNTFVTYNGQPDPAVNKAPNQWSNL